MTQGVAFKVTQAVDTGGNFINGFDDIAPAIRDTIALEITGGPGTGEKRFYSRGYGLTGYYAETASGVAFHVRSSEDGSTLPTQCEEQPATEDDELAKTVDTRDKNEFVFYPIEQFTNHLNEDNWQDAAKDLAVAGYGTQCIEFSVDKEIEGAYDRWLQLHEGDLINIDDMDEPAKNTVGLDATQGTMGFLRNAVLAPGFNTDAESYYGTPKGVVGNKYDQAIGASEIYSQMELGKQFAYKIRALQVREGIAMYGADLETRATTLFKPVSGLEHDMHDTLAYFYESELLPVELALTYEEVADRTPFSKTEFEGLKQRLSEVPFNIGDVSLATYVVVGLEQPKDEKNNILLELFPFLADQFNYFTDLNPNDVEADPYKNEDILSRYRLGAIQIPTPAVDYAKNLEHFQYFEPQELARKTRRPSNVIIEEEAQDKAERDITLQNIDAVKNIGWSSDRLTLRGIFKEEDVREGYEPGILALMLLINAQNPGCEGFLADSAQNMKIGTNYDIEDNPSLIEANGINFGKVLNFKEQEGEKTNPLVTAFSLVSDVLVGKDVPLVRDEVKPKIKLYTVSLYRHTPDLTAQMVDPFLPNSILRSMEETEVAWLTSDKPELTTPSLLGEGKFYRGGVAVDNVVTDVGSNEVCKTYSEPDPALADECEEDVDGNVIPGSCTSKFCARIAGDADQGLGINLLGKSLNRSIRLKQYLWKYNSPQYQHTQSCADVECYLAFAGAQDATDNPTTPTDYDPLGNTPAANSCSAYENQQIAVPTYGAMQQQIETVAKTYFDGDPNGKYANMLYGILNIEGSPFLAAQQAGVSSISCKDGYGGRRLINDCGAIGPFQVIQGVCVKDTCPVQPDTLAFLKTFKRNVNPCDFNETLESVAQMLSGVSNDSAFTAGVSEAQMPYFLTGWYYGFTKENYLLKNKCEGAPAVSGCNGLNYCTCAVDGFVL
jgi:hypothetical protein